VDIGFEKGHMPIQATNWVCFWWVDEGFGKKIGFCSSIGCSNGYRVFLKTYANCKKMGTCVKKVQICI